MLFHMPTMTPPYWLMGSLAGSSMATKVADARDVLRLATEWAGMGVREIKIEDAKAESLTLRSSRTSCTRTGPEAELSGRRLVRPLRNRPLVARQRSHLVRSRAMRRSAFARPDWTGKTPRAVLIRTLANQRRTVSRGSTYGIERDHHERGTRRYQPEAVLANLGYRDHKGNPHPPTEGGVTSSYLEQKRCDVELGYEAGL